MSGTGDWSAGALEELAGLIAVRVGIWNHLEYPEKTCRRPASAALRRSGPGTVRSRHRPS